MNLQKLLQGLESFEYSGRGMFGRTCLAFSASPQEVSEALMDTVTDMDMIPAVKAVIRSMRSDSLGKGYVTYFPDVPFQVDFSGYEDEHLNGFMDIE